MENRKCRLIEALGLTQETVAEFSHIAEVVSVMTDTDGALELYRWFGRVFERYNLPGAPPKLLLLGWDSLDSATLPYNPSKLSNSRISHGDSRLQKLLAAQP